MQKPLLALFSIFPQSPGDTEWPVLPMEGLCISFRSLQVEMNQLYPRAREPGSLPSLRLVLMDGSPSFTAEIPELAENQNTTDACRRRERVSQRLIFTS